MTLSSLPPVADWAPWTDRRGRLHPLRTVVFGLLLLPLAWLAIRWALDMLGSRGLNVAIHSTGYWSAWIFIASLAVTPAKALLGQPNIVVVRRMIGNAALFYAVLHTILYVFDQNWRLATVAREILVRPYLTIGFVALLGFGILGATSTDGWIKRLGRDWKRLHKIAYGLGVLAMVHFFLQSKADVSQATVAAGVFAWLMIWRVLPAGRDRGPIPLVLLAFAAGFAALAFEFVWCALGTKIDPVRIARAELDIFYGLRPAALVLFLGLVVAGLVELRALAATRFGGSVAYSMLVYALGGLAGTVVAFVLGWPTEDSLGGYDSPALMTATWCSLFALLGLARHRLGDARQRHMVDALWIAGMLYLVVAMGTESRVVGLTVVAAIVAGALFLTLRLWPVSRGSAVMVVPLASLMTYEAFGFL
ncbi:MAG: ferric reductase-like transmembrane domain-containing protein [Gemmatimonadaceae bacterium]|nr:ferric reductase-like transmembrane domain-containing protein [Acetobacteraceae bacterium]